MENFLGKDGFIWWMGVVEDRKDPLKLGRCRVRIFGWHVENKKLIPTESLPWSTPIYPANSSKTFTTPTEGDWVVGYFMDGVSAQFPCYMGVLPAIPSTAGNPQEGFTDPRDDTQLMLAPNLPKTVTLENDGSGSTTVNKPAVRNPAIVGFPNINPLVINDIRNPPPQIDQRVKELTSNIAGPNAQVLGTEIAGYAQGAASTLQSNLPSLTSSLNSLIPSATSLATSLVPPELQSQIPSSSSLTSSISAASADLSKAMTQGFTSASQAMAAAQSEVSAQLATATDAANKAVSDAAASSSLSMDDLKAKAGNIAGDIASKLSALAPANITTKTPVNLNGVVPNVDLGSVNSGDKVNELAPNPIPAQVPLEKTGSTQQKSLENSISLYESMFKAQYEEFSQKASSAKNVEELNLATQAITNNKSKNQALQTEILTAAHRQGTGDAVADTLQGIVKKYTDMANSLYESKYATLQG